MNIFFKLLAIGGFGGAIAGAFYLSKQGYTNNHVTSEESATTAKGLAEALDVKRQPTTMHNPAKPEQQQEAVTKK